MNTGVDKAYIRGNTKKRKQATKGNPLSNGDGWGRGPTSIDWKICYGRGVEGTNIQYLMVPTYENTNLQCQTFSQEVSQR